MKVLIGTTLLTLVWGLGACSKSTTSDPSTSNREDLNPPSGLISLTKSGKVVLTWTAANAETDFKGFDIFAVKGKVADLGKATFPANLPADLTAGNSIPRCADNSAIFEKFGLDATTTACSGDAEAPAAKSTGLNLADTTTTTTDTAVPPKGLIQCDENTTDTTISLVVTSPALAKQTCTVSKLSDKTALADGTTYTFFATAVSGDKNENISWTSNFVQDTPATVIYDNAAWSIDNSGSFYYVPLAKILAYSVADADITGTKGSCTDAAVLVSGSATKSQICSVNQVNAQAAADDGIYIGRLGTGSYPERTFLSVPAGGSIKIQARGPQENSATRAGLPGDAALPNATAPYDAAGTLYPIYGNQVFDILVTGTDGNHYGKVVIGAVALASDENSALTIPVTIVMQKAVAVRDYIVEEGGFH